MDYIRSEANGQLCFETSSEKLWIPSCLYGFHNTETEVVTGAYGEKEFRMKGNVDVSEEDRVCPECNARMHIHNSGNVVTLRHLSLGFGRISICFPRKQMKCPKCGKTASQYISFKAEGHRITTELETYTKDLLAKSTYTLKQVGELTGLDENTVKAIDMQRLSERYIKDEKLIKPEREAIYLGIDEFKLHKGHKYATHIIDMETGHILWIAEGKKKQVVYDFIEHVGLEWMSNVVALACDMNSDFEEAFREKCPHIKTVFDYFHIVKNFNDKVISEIRKEEQQRLTEEGDVEGARSLKRSKYILTSSRDTLRRKDAAADNPRPEKESVFPRRTWESCSDREARYDKLISKNELLFTCDLVKEKLRVAFKRTNSTEMVKDISETISICNATKNRHFIWFAKMLNSHFEGIVAHADYPISNGKIEGINNRIKTLRRQGYGYPDDEYFFLKLFDMSRSKDLHPTKI